MQRSALMPFSSTCSLDEFSCGESSIDSWLKKRAAKNALSGASRTYIAANHGQHVVAFYSLAVGNVAQAATPGNIKRNMPDPIPVAILARPGVDMPLQRRGVEKALVRDAVLRVRQAASFVGIRALLVHAIHKKAAFFYHECGFQPSPVDDVTLMIRLDPLYVSSTSN